MSDPGPTVTEQVAERLNRARGSMEPTENVLGDLFLIIAGGIDELQKEREQCESPS